MPKTPKRPSILPKTAKQVKPRHWITPAGVHYVKLGNSVAIYSKLWRKGAKPAWLRKQRKK